MRSLQLPLIVLVLVLVVVSYLAYRSKDTARLYRSMAATALSDVNTSESIGVVTEEDLMPLPRLVQDYLRYVGVVGKPKIVNLRIVTEGPARMDLRKGWGKLRIEQIDTFGAHPTRLSYVNVGVSGLPVKGLDSYVGKIGNMLMKPFGLFTVVDSTSEEMNKTGAVQLLSDMCLTAPATLIDSRIRWEPMDGKSIKAWFNDGRLVVSAVLHFDDLGRLVSFSTYDKVYSPDGKTNRRVRWSVENKEFGVLNGLNLPTYSEAVWHLDKGDQVYGKIKPVELQYNITKG